MRQGCLVCKTHLNPVFPPGSSSARLMRGVVCRSDRPKISCRSRRVEFGRLKRHNKAVPRRSATYPQCYEADHPDAQGADGSQEQQGATGRWRAFVRAQDCALACEVPRWPAQMRRGATVAALPRSPLAGCRSFALMG
jgi:hypothetical protein